MASKQLDEEAIFHVARGIPDVELRCVYLAQICAGDRALRDRVEALLQAHEQSQEFLRSGHPEPPPTVECTPLTERPGMIIGRYKLMEQVGEGGMGVVFVAEQERPIRRKVALKVIKPGMDSKAVVARFEAERQALALMDHPNIAKVLDAGNTDTGRPYFVMEFVRGVSITEYCDVNKLNVTERLQLFTQVCQAVQHAHQKAIIHRDLKPSNVLVTLHDGQPVPKIIDFGIAKALNQRLTERTLYTRMHQALGTLAYMSPEQAELSGLDVDTRTDVYGLGVLLYELLNDPQISSCLPTDCSVLRLRLPSALVATSLREKALVRRADRILHVVFPGAGEMSAEVRSPDWETHPEWRLYRTILEGGRAVCWPVYKGRCERNQGYDWQKGGILLRDYTVYMAKDLCRAVDYLKTRDDIDRGRLVYYGFSYGAAFGPLMTTCGADFCGSIFISGGLCDPETLFREGLPPEVDPYNYLGSVKTPTLLLTNMQDAIFPRTFSQIPYVNGMTPSKKVWHEFDTAHGGFPMSDVFTLINEWCDENIGRVTKSRHPTAPSSRLSQTR